jgi:hypothetical protein
MDTSQNYIERVCICGHSDIVFTRDAFPRGMQLYYPDLCLECKAKARPDIFIIKGSPPLEVTYQPALLDLDAKLRDTER